MSLINISRDSLLTLKTWVKKRSQIYLVNENEDYLWLVDERRREMKEVIDCFFLLLYYIIRLNHIKAIHVANNSKWRVNISSKEKSI